MMYMPGHLLIPEFSFKSLILIIQFAPFVIVYSQTNLIKGDLLIVPVLNVKKKNDSSILVSTGQNSWISSVYCAPYCLWGQVFKQLWILLTEADVTCMKDYW